MAGQALGDLLAGVAGAPVNRPAMDAYITQGQAMAGLRTAQTEDALAQARTRRDQAAANDRLQASLLAQFQAQGDPHAEENSRAAADVMIGQHGDAKTALEAQMQGQKNQAFGKIADPNADPNARLAADQALNPSANPYQAVGDQLIPRMAPNSQTGPAHVQQTPVSQANVNDKQASANLHQAQADAGGFNPHTGATAMGNLPDDERAALAQAVNDQRLDPMRINSRNAALYASIEMRNPGMTNFNKLHADAVLQSNPTFQQRAMTFEALPTIMSHMTSLGKKIGYSDNRTIGKMQQFMNGEFNDPDYTEYMSVRNDALMNIANVMRGVGMSDQAHRAEMEAAAPTLSPLALDGWLKGQMSSLQPRLDQQRRVTHLGEKPAGHGGTAPVPVGTAPGGPPQAAGGGAMSLDDYLKGQGF